MRLGAVRLPELGRVEAAEGGDAAGGFVRRDGPGGQGGDFAEAGEGGVLGWRWCVSLEDVFFLVRGWVRGEGGGNVLGSRVRGSSSVTLSRSASWRREMGSSASSPLLAVVSSIESTPWRGEASLYQFMRAVNRRMNRATLPKLRAVLGATRFSVPYARSSAWGLI